VIENLGVIIAAVTGLLVAFGQVLSSRQKTVTLNAKQMEKDLAVRNTQYLVALRHIYTVEQIIASLGQDVPVRPAQLAPDWKPKEKDEKGIEAGAT
jgi:hypothetical protein